MEQSKPNPIVLATLVAALFVTFCAMVVAVVLARHPSTIVVYERGGAPAGPAPVAPPPSVKPAAMPGATPAAKPLAPPSQLAWAMLASAPDARDPFDPLWSDVAPAEVPLQPQQITMPMLDQATISSVRVQAARDRRRMSWRLSWSAAEPNMLVDNGRFADAVAIQFPLQPDTSFMMGERGKPVHILHWKAIWQRDIDRGFQDVQDLHPNYWSDFYWFTKSELPARVGELVQSQYGQKWLIGIQAGNPMADEDRKSPVEELVAEGFGTATHLPPGGATARGVWREGRWTVVISRTIDGEDPLAMALRAGAVSNVSFAVWDGKAGNVGGKKHWCTWIPLTTR